MNLKALRRDDRILKRVYTIKDRRLYTKEDISILFPARYEQGSMLTISKTVNVVGVFATVDKISKFGVTKLPATVSLTPAAITDIDINGKIYKELLFKANSYVTESIEFIPSKDIAYAILDEWIVRNNNIPFFLGYEDLLDIMLKLPPLTGTTLGLPITDVSTFIAYIARDSKNRFLRENHTRDEILKMSSITFRGLTDVDKGYKNVASLLANGTFLDKGLTSGLNMENPPVTELGKTMSK